jgi:ribonuclease J
MHLIIHRGTHEIGGSCVELQTDEARILIDFGLPLTGPGGADLDQKSFKGKSRESLISSGVLPDIQGLYGDEVPLFDGILISHAHQDHYGLLSYVNPKIPIYLSAGALEMIKAAYYFGQTDYKPTNTKLICSWDNPFQIKDIKITPYLADHAGFDARAFLIEAEGKKLFYSGDFRGHGRKGKVFDYLLEHPPSNVDYLLLEGTTIGRTTKEENSEKTIEEDLVKILKKQKEMIIITCSSQNIDRIVTIYRACKRTNHIFVIDPYTAYILDKCKAIAPGAPQFDWGANIRVFFTQNSYTNKLAKTKDLFKFKSAKITREEILKNLTNIVLKDNFKNRNDFFKRKDIVDPLYIYSQWSGYLKKDKQLPGLLDRCNGRLVKLHTSGHAYPKDLRRLETKLKPKKIIPIHTEFPGRYKELFGDKIMQCRDGEVYTL